MKSWHVIRYSAARLFNNIGAAFRISAGLYIILIAADLYSESTVKNSSSEDEQALSELLFFVVFAITAPWIAIGWHRFLLAGEIPTWFFPKLHIGKIYSYFWRCLIIISIFLILTLASFYVVLIVLLIMGFDYYWGTNAFHDNLFYTFAMLPCFYFFYRVSPILPAVALGENISMRKAWRSTKGATRVIGLLLLIDLIIVGLPMIFIPPELSILYILWIIFPEWLVIMFGISVVTTIYSHYVLGHELE